MTSRRRRWQFSAGVPGAWPALSTVDDGCTIDAELMQTMCTTDIVLGTSIKR